MWLHKLIVSRYLKYSKQSREMEVKKMEAWYPNYGSLFKAAINQLFYLLKMDTIPFITGITIEVTNSCNLRCKVCPTTQMKRKRGFMDFELFKKIIDENSNVENVLLYHWGEPLLHPKIIDMINYAASKGVKPWLSTNGVLLTDKLMDKLLDTRLSRMQFSLDGVGETYTKVRGVDYKFIEKKIRKFIEKKKKKNTNLKIDLSMVVYEGTKDNVKEFYKTWEKSVDRIQLLPKIEFNPKERKARCKEIWRGHPIVLWDGSVVPCCVDYDARMVLGNVRNDKLKEIINNGNMKKMRQNQNKGIFYGMCNLCSEYESEISPRFE